MTKKANTCPSWLLGFTRLKASKSTLAALSISSIDMSWISMLRRARNPAAPTPNKTEASAKYVPTPIWSYSVRLRATVIAPMMATKSVIEITSNGTSACL